MTVETNISRSNIVFQQNITYTFLYIVCVSCLRMAEKNISMSTTGVDVCENVDNSENKDTKSDRNEVTDYSRKCLLYGVNDIPPFHITVVCGLQVCCNRRDHTDCGSSAGERRLNAFQLFTIQSKTPPYYGCIIMDP